MLYFHLSLRDKKKRQPSGSAGIGRQARLRILWVYARVGSSPSPAVEKSRKSEMGFLLFLYDTTNRELSCLHEKVFGPFSCRKRTAAGFVWGCPQYREGCRIDQNREYLLRQNFIQGRKANADHRLSLVFRQRLYCHGEGGRKDKCKYLSVFYQKSQRRKAKAIDPKDVEQFHLEASRLGIQKILAHALIP